MTTKRDLFRDGFFETDCDSEMDVQQGSDLCRYIELGKANEMLRAARLSSKKVWCRKDDGKWACDEHEGFARTTHSARLVAIEDINDASKD